MTLNWPSELCWSFWMPQADRDWALLFSLPMVLQGWVPGLGHNLHSCPASSLEPPFTTKTPLLIFARLLPSIHKLCSPFSTLIRGNSHTMFSLFAVLGARYSQSLLQVDQLPHRVVFLRTANSQALVFSSREGAPSPFSYKLLAPHTAQISNQIEDIQVRVHQSQTLLLSPFSRNHSAPQFLW